MMPMTKTESATGITFGVWLPVYGGWLRTFDHPQVPDIRSCLEVGQRAQVLGYDFLYASENLLNCIHGPTAPVVDAWSLLGALAATTQDIGLCGAVKPGFRSPLLAARMVDTVSEVAGRRLGINVACGWWKDEFELADVAWLDHERRYDRADSFLRSLSRLYDPAMARDVQADSYEGTAPRSFGLAQEWRPDIWISGHSERATELMAEWGDCLFLNGLPDIQLVRHITQARQAAIRWGRKISIAVNAFVIVNEDARTARTRREDVVRRRNDASIAFFRAAMETSGAAAWADLTDELMVDSNSGFVAGLIGSFEDVRARVEQLAAMGVDKIVCQFDDPLRDVGPFMQHVINPLRASGKT